MSPTQRLLLILRVSMETAVVAALAYWGVHTGGSTPTKIALGIAAPTVGFGVWGAVDFHQAGRLAEPLRLTEELVISLLAALALYATSKHALGIALGGLSIAYHTLVYASGERLLKARPAIDPTAAVHRTVS